MCAAGVRLAKIRDLDENDRSVFLVGVIIAIQPTKTFPNKRGGEDRATWGFTIRDSPNDFINATVWGQEQFVFDLSSDYHIGDVVEIANPKINRRRIGEQSDNYAPDASSQYQLNIVPVQTTLLHFTAANPVEIVKLMHCQTKPPGDYFTLNDIHMNKENMINATINLLAAVRLVGAKRLIKARGGRDIECREVTVLDQTNNAFLVTLWNLELILRAENWLPRETVLFFADVRISYSEFRKQMTGSDGPKTIVTENPCTVEADGLREFARCAPLNQAALLDSVAAMIPDPQSIRNAMTINQLLVRAEAIGDKAGSDEGHFSALLYCFVTKMDLDGCSRVLDSRWYVVAQGSSLDKAVSVVKRRWCHMIFNAECGSELEDQPCMKESCPVVQGRAAPRSVRSFNVRVTLSDHTGSIEGCRLNSPIADKVFGIRPGQFAVSTMDSRTALKWRYLLERCATRVLVLPTRWGQLRPQVSILACEIADPSEVAARIPTF